MRRDRKIASLFRDSLTHVVGFNAVWIVHLGRRNNLFALISASRNPISPAALAERSNLFAPAVKAWCSAAIGLGFLAEKEGRVTLPASVEELVLNEHSPYYVGGQFSYSALRSLDYGFFDRLFKSGKEKPPSSPNTIQAFDEVTSWDHYAFLRTIKIQNNELHKLLLRGCKVLDIGCGTGKFMQRLHSTYPRSEVIGIDPYADQIKRVSRITPKHMNLKILRGTGETMNFLNEFDFIYLGESMYLMDNKQVALKNCYRALRTGGTIAILEGLRTEREHEIGDENKLVQSMQLDFVLQGHEFMTKRQIAVLLRRARFKNVKFINLGVSFFLVTASRR